MRTSATSPARRRLAITALFVLVGAGALLGATRASAGQDEGAEPSATTTTTITTTSSTTTTTAAADVADSAWGGDVADEASEADVTAVDDAVDPTIPPGRTKSAAVASKRAAAPSSTVPITVVDDATEDPAGTGDREGCDDGDPSDPSARGSQSDDHGWDDERGGRDRHHDGDDGDESDSRRRS